MKNETHITNASAATTAHTPPVKVAHTPEPWRIVTTDHKSGNRAPIKTHVLADKTGAQLFTGALPNAERIVACVNACAGIANPTAMREQRDELLEVVRALVDAGGIMEPSVWFNTAREVLAKAEGGAK